VVRILRRVFLCRRLLRRRLLRPKLAPLTFAPPSFAPILYSGSPVQSIEIPNEIFDFLIIFLYCLFLSFWCKARVRSRMYYFSLFVWYSSSSRMENINFDNEIDI
jgi:hypothetical protein